MDMQIRRALHLVSALLLLAGLSGCADPIAPFIWSIDPNAAPVGESVRIVATGYYVGFYGSTIDFNGAAVLDPGVSVQRTAADPRPSGSPRVCGDHGRCAGWGA